MKFALSWCELLCLYDFRLLITAFHFYQAFDVTFFLYSDLNWAFIFKSFLCLYVQYLYLVRFYVL